MSEGATEVREDNIQGVGLPGFRKDHQELLFVRFGEAKKARRLIGHISPTVANHKEVAAFNGLYSEIRGRGGEAADAWTVQATWLAVGLTAGGMEELGADLNGLPEGEGKTAFSETMRKRASEIGDTREGDAPSGWKRAFRPDAKPIHMLLIVAADNGDDLDHRVKELRQRIEDTDCDVAFSERGHALRGAAHAQEHFGFRDGISQPSIVGLESAPAEHEPDAVALGEFVLGYHDQTGETPTVSDTFKDGSFIVFRRLQQHVFDFRSQAATPVPEADPTLSPPQMEAKMIGRWPSGTPTAASPKEDPGDSGETNAFDYEDDQEGERTPRFAHIRKVNPRKEKVPDPENESAGRHRMIRRGIPFGEPLAKDATSDDDRERGLHFISVVADVSRQFEFIQRQWANDPNFPNGGKPGTPGSPTNRPRRANHQMGPTPLSASGTPAPRMHFIKQARLTPSPWSSRLSALPLANTFSRPRLRLWRA